MRLKYRYSAALYHYRQQSCLSGETMRLYQFYRLLSVLICLCSIQYYAVGWHLASLMATIAMALCSVSALLTFFGAK